MIRLTCLFLVISAAASARAETTYTCAAPLEPGTTSEDIRPEIDAVLTLGDDARFAALGSYNLDGTPTQLSWDGSWTMQDGEIAMIGRVAETGVEWRAFSARNAADVLMLTLIRPEAAPIPFRCLPKEAG